MRLRILISALALFCFSAAADGQSATATSLTISAGVVPAASVAQGTAVTLTAIVSLTAGGAAAPPGQVQFCEVGLQPQKCTDIRLLATEQLSGTGTASYKFYPGPGPHTYQAMFLGTHLEAASSSTSTVLTVTPFYTTTTALSAGGATSSGYTLTATVTGSQGSIPPTGTVTFEDASNGNYVLGTATLVPGTATAPTGLSFATSQIIPTEGVCLTALVADVNGDGKPDVVLGLEAYDDYGEYTDTVEVFLGNGDGTFTKMPSVPVLLSVIALGVGDFNGDGKPDLLAFGVTPGVPANQVQVLLGNGDGTFAMGQAIPNPDPNQPYPALNPPPSPPPLVPFSVHMANSTVAVGDFNGDGIADVAITTGVNETVAVFFGKGDGTFRAGPATFAGLDPDGIAVGDFNGDGKADVAITNPVTTGTTSTVTILLGNGDGTFTPAAPISGLNSQSAAIVTGDFDGNGTLDLAMENWGYPGEVNVFLGNGDGTFAQAPNSPIEGTSENGSALAVGDFNGDGKADLATLGGGQYVSLLLGNGDGTFQSAINFDVSPTWAISTPVFGISAISLGDFVGSGLSGITSADYGNYEASVLLPQTTPQTSTATLSGVSIVGSGQHNIVAVYSGSSAYQASTSPPLLMDATPQPTTVTVTANPTGSMYGQPVTLTATIAPDTAEDHDATGTVTFTADGAMVGTANLVGGVATFQTTFLPVGSDDVIATYSGDTNFAGGVGYGAAIVSGFNSLTVLTSAPNPSYVGEAVTLTATVSGAGSSVTPTGTVTFYDSATVIGQGKLNASGQASFTTSSLILGPHSLTAVYAANAGYYGSTSAAITQVVAVAVSTTTLTAAPNPAGIGQTVMLTATATGSQSATPTGTVTFYDGTTQLGQATLNSSGQASYSISTLALGTHTLTAAYAGNANYTGSTSASVSELIESSGFTITLSNPSITLQTFSHTTTTVTLASLGNFTDGITLSCGNPPAYVTCTFTPNPATLTGNGTATVSLYLDTGSIVAAANLPGPLNGSPRHPPTPSRSFASLGLLLAPFGLFVTLPNRRRKPLAPRLLLAILSTASIFALASCGSIITTVNSAAPGTYAIPITATGASTGVTHTAQLTLTVTP